MNSIRTDVPISQNHSTQQKSADVADTRKLQENAVKFEDLLTPKNTVNNTTQSANNSQPSQSSRSLGLNLASSESLDSDFTGLISNNGDNKAGEKLATSITQTDTKTSTLIAQSLLAPKQAQQSSSSTFHDTKVKTASELGAQNIQPGDAILGAFLHTLNNSGVQAMQQSTQSASSTEAIGRVNQIAQQVAQQIMVALPDPQGKQEVVIVLKENVLVGTQVHVARHDNNLNITFQSSVATSANLLSQSQPMMQQALQTHLGEVVVVQVRDTSSSSGSQTPANTMNNQGNDSQRRSSQYMEYAPDEQ